MQFVAALVFFEPEWHLRGWCQFFVWMSDLCFCQRTRKPRCATIYAARSHWRLLISLNVVLKILDVKAAGRGDVLLVGVRLAVRHT